MHMYVDQKWKERRKGRRRNTNLLNTTYPSMHMSRASAGHQTLHTLRVYNTFEEFILTITCATFFLTFSSPSLTALCTSFVSPDCDTANRPPLRPGMSLRLTWDNVSYCIIHVIFVFDYNELHDAMSLHVTLDCTCHVRPRHVCHLIACDDMLCSDISKDMTL